MKKLDRNIAQQPACLSNFTSPPDTWDNVVLRDKWGIWSELYKIQDRFCVYCESPAEQGAGKGHIEHFFHKGCAAYSHLTFSWPNLFGCCDSNEHCGHYKDQDLPGGIPRDYDPSLVLKPDEDEPDDYLKFLSTGTIEEKSGLNCEQKARATETITALNLKAVKLVTSRRSQIKLFENRVLALFELVDQLGLTQEEFEAQFLEIEIESQSEAHRTAIRQAIF
ncbi:MULTISPECIES: retron Ec78 anti-phage system effector HNH endonuclease PtuB [unclassified Colwellia]|uniref:retron Ec78 anti-phage system effector HNH endonuclease PtuB n=1 Tax=unclassified Colwellia TaxID=196834 RepID=UPI0015F5BC2F|nr:MULTISPECIES: retron Ec78 anti-phage system effector HNH endonuclease PtuB [unclassified Colwellia]MBA6353542.1 TIGR02646 family protein [Colwellia sp. BRX9-1]MBA6357053.1 TIGR02646 family protein [Colwellia sp. BRX8-3]MBA6361081.1 TIGR02646 family protein [Colwellia sp. BRX8-6]MBA6369066.1 TIGR02646 family protein [Colwellia sp. BRX8-5]MBA6377454.1 TIGR02646 family protein [Colwellia sp. BRX8-2]